MHDSWAKVSTTPRKCFLVYLHPVWFPTVFVKTIVKNVETQFSRFFCGTLNDSLILRPPFLTPSIHFSGTDERSETFW